ncbi:hypothetical protein ASPWEDRAFT_49317 [Aspergillus wentii DTO 134E9]|uniref:Alpha/beta hydrolase fold-3 domain-containing protein n=1 Tax=Aspergillus wentii DTO 134E9 TaxID=1073089 RepID=A0A1L9RWH1_ASPWE|nr:uncharacterized protein ASPWEDRAFT_49317 [Aspergillus wentii DTO 134E9]KAI9929019.1 hypothetical protein MW887_001414 [Aspergillus wentii]OJJ39290.1 hypothetical protein ASPWEDRAFT_49317 [Aspergillus wentii DTO 134E9]
MSALSSYIALLKVALPRIPLVLKTVLLHGLHLSPGSGKQDLRTELIVVVIRSFMVSLLPVGQQQKRSMRDPGIKGPMWVSKVTLPQPDKDVEQAVIKAIEDLKLGDITYRNPGVVPVEAEWTGYRKGVGKNAPQPEISEEDKYRELRKDASSDSVILYFHGGAYYLMDPCTHRIPVSRLAKLTGASVLSVRYRLAPQNPFPAPLVDSLVAYLSLIAPPPGSLHEPVPANKIVFSGDSAGGNLCLVLLQTLLTLRRISPTIRFHGKDIPIELPAGVSTTSPWCDITRSLPSVHKNASFDYLPPPRSSENPFPFPEDEHWPCDPPRVDPYVHANTVLHPLVSPVAARRDLWKDAPPVFINVGEEGLADDGLIMARKLHQADVPVVIEQFEGMPHCFGMMMVNTPSGKRYFKGLSDFCRDAVAGRVKPSGNMTYIGFKLRSTREIPLDELNSDLSDDEVFERISKSGLARGEGEKAYLKQLTQKAKL